MFCSFWELKTSVFHCGFDSGLNADKKKKQKQTPTTRTNNSANFPRDIGFVLIETVLMLCFCFPRQLLHWFHCLLSLKACGNS